MQLSTLFVAVLASTVTAFPVWNPVILPPSHAAIERQAGPPPTRPTPTGPAPTGGYPMPTGTGYPLPPRAPAGPMFWRRPAAPPAPQAAERSVADAVAKPEPIKGAAPAPWFAAV